ncbi:MAG TPA: CocE/NonD family hydrolase [Pirellulales bacterium]|nr:CocE/NonD family hydrolase [Pirellulales bacterium]
MPRLAFFLILLFVSAELFAQEKQPEFKPPDDIAYRSENIISDGTRMAADIFAPRTPAAEKLPTIVMSHGWGGTVAALRPDAVVFARAGYQVVAFDYRGWGNSDSRLVLAGKKPDKEDGKFVAEVKEVREVVDPIDQTTDILNAIPGVTHYGVYKEARGKAQQEAIAWYDEHLKYVP